MAAQSTQLKIEIANNKVLNLDNSLKQARQDSRIQVVLPKVQKEVGKLCLSVWFYLAFLILIVTLFSIVAFESTDKKVFWVLIGCWIFFFLMLTLFAWRRKNQILAKIHEICQAYSTPEETFHFLPGYSIYPSHTLRITSKSNSSSDQIDSLQ